MAGEVVASEQETPGGPAPRWRRRAKPAARVRPDRQDVPPHSSGTVPAESVVAVACTAQWSGTVAVDEHSQPIRDAIIWMDSRGAPYVRRVTGGIVKVQGYRVIKLARWLRVTAAIPARSGKDPIARILWLKTKSRRPTVGRICSWSRRTGRSRCPGGHAGRGRHA